MAMMHGMEAINYRFCPRCKIRRRATKTLTIAKLPIVLLVHLKRFSYAGPFRDKVETLVDFPVDSFNLTSYLPPTFNNNSKQNFNYDLYAVSVHFGYKHRIILEG